MFCIPKCLEKGITDFFQIIFGFRDNKSSSYHIHSYMYPYSTLYYPIATACARSRL